MQLVRWIRGEQHHDHLCELAAEADHIVVNVAFLSEAGVDLVEQLLKIATVDLVVSLYLRVTRKAALVRCRKLLAKARKHPLRVGVLPAVDAFHGKVFAVRQGTTATVVLGSANWTNQGLYGVGEVSSVLEGLWQSAQGALTEPKAWSIHGDTAALDAAIIGYHEAQWPGALLEGADDGLVLVGAEPASAADDRLVEALVPEELLSAANVTTFLTSGRDGPKRAAVLATRPGDPVVIVNSANPATWPDKEDLGRACVGKVVDVLPTKKGAGLVVVYKIIEDDLDGAVVLTAVGRRNRRVDATRILALLD